MSKERQKLTVILFDDDIELVDYTKGLLDSYLSESVSEHTKLALGVAFEPKKAIDLIKMAGQDCILISDLRMDDDTYPYKVWEAAQDHKAKIILYTNVDSKDARVAEITKRFKMRYCDKASKFTRVIDLIEREFPEYFKNISEPRDLNFREGRRK